MCCSTFVADIVYLDWNGASLYFRPVWVAAGAFGRELTHTHTHTHASDKHSKGIPTQSQTHAQTTQRHATTNVRRVIDDY